MRRPLGGVPNEQCHRPSARGANYAFVQDLRNGNYADLPAAWMLRISVSPALLALADDVIE